MDRRQKLEVKNYNVSKIIIGLASLIIGIILYYILINTYSVTNWRPHLSIIPIFIGLWGVLYTKMEKIEFDKVNDKFRYWSFRVIGGIETENRRLSNIKKVNYKIRNQMIGGHILKVAEVEFENGDTFRIHDSSGGGGTSIRMDVTRKKAVQVSEFLNKKLDTEDLDLDEVAVSPTEPFKED